MFAAQTNTQDLIQSPSLYTYGILVLFGVVNFWLYRKYRSVELLKERAENWENLYQSEKEQKEKLEKINNDLEKKIITMEGDIKVLTSQLAHLGHMPDFAKIYEAIMEHDRQSHIWWKEVNEFLNNNVEVVRIKDRRT